MYSKVAKRFILIVVLIFLYQANTWSQVFALADLNFSLPPSLIVNKDLEYGLSSHPDDIKYIEDLMIKDYILVYKLDGEMHDFYYNEADSHVDKITMNGDDNPRAVINIGFWGTDFNMEELNITFPPAVLESKPSVLSFFSDLINNLNSSKSRAQDVKLVVVRFKSKANESTDPLLYASMSDRLKLKSRYLFLLWDTSVKKDLPNIIRNAEIKTYPMERSSFLKSYENNPLIFVSEDDIQNPDIDNFPSLNFIGNYDENLLINYEVYDRSERRQ